MSAFPTKVREAPAIEVREATTLDMEGVAALHNEHYGHEKTSQHWIWEYQTHHPALAVFTVMTDNGRIVGTQGMIPIHLRSRGETFLSGKSESSLLDPKYRGGPAFRELYAFAMSLCKAKGMQCIWGLTTAAKVWRNRLLFAVYEDAVYTSSSVLNFLAALSEIRGMKQSMVRKVQAHLLATLGYLYGSVRRSLIGKSVGKRQFTIEDDLRSPHDLDHLYQRLSAFQHPDLIYIWQDEDYRRWRIASNPNARYMTLFLYEDNTLQSYCYVNMAKRSVAYLTDLTFADDEAGSYLLQAVLHRLHGEGIATVSFLGNLKNPLVASVFDVLGRFGFIKKRSPLAIVMKNISCGCAETMYDARNWYLNGLWTEER